MRAALTDKDIDVWLCARKRNCGVSERIGQSGQVEHEDEEPMGDHVSAAAGASTQRVEWHHHPNIGQDIHHLLVGQLPSEAMHGGEGCSVRNRDQELPIGF